MKEVQFKEVNGVVFYTTNGRSWIEREGDHQSKYEVWVAMGKPECLPGAVLQSVKFI